MTSEGLAHIVDAKLRLTTVSRAAPETKDLGISTARVKPGSVGLCQAACSIQVGVYCWLRPDRFLWAADRPARRCRLLVCEWNVVKSACSAAGPFDAIPPSAIFESFSAGGRRLATNDTVA